MGNIVSEFLYSVYVVIVSYVTYVLYTVIYFVFVYYTSGCSCGFCVVDVLYGFPPVSTIV